MTLDVERVCPDCRRFYHGPAGYIPHWYGVPGFEAGGACTNPRHASAAPELEDSPAVWLPRQREAYDVGVRRSLDARRSGRVHRYDWNPDPDVQRVVDGYAAVAEEEVAFQLGREWIAREAGPDRGVDVAPNIGVRWADGVGGRTSLIIHDDEPQTNISVLVLYIPPEHEIVGWLPVAEASSVGIWRTDVRFPAWFVPRRRLLSLDDIPGDNP